MTFTHAVYIPSATVNEASKLPTAAIRKCYLNGNYCSEAKTYTVTDAVTGDAVGTGSIDFIAQTGTTNQLNAVPTLSSHIGFYTLNIVQTNASGEDKTFDGVTVQVGCTLLNIPTPSPPNTFTFALYDNTMYVNMSDMPYIQEPLCDYSLVYDFVWTLPGTAPGVIY